LIGRGVYALKEWGYKSGVVSDIVEQILKEKGEPMTKDEITKAVLDQRDVKPNTVALALNKNLRFERTNDGKYSLKKQS